MPAALPAQKPPQEKVTKAKEKDKDRERSSSAQPSSAERLKIVVRRLPANLPEDIFWQSVAPWVNDEKATWRSYCPGKMRKKVNKENIPSRAYIAFKSEELLGAFAAAYDGHIFRDKSGVESITIVEYAPYPKIPAEKKKPDPRNATIDKDEDYISFLETLKAQETAEPLSLEALIAANRPPSPPKTTPLLEALKAERSATKDREAILRNHAHYHQLNAAGRKDEKKKAAIAAASGRPAKPTAEGSGAAAGSSSKRGGKKAQKEAAKDQAQQAPAKGPLAAKVASASQAAGGRTQAKPPKPPRAPKGKDVKPPATDDAAASSEAPVTANQPPAGASRRGRPVLGFASRQFKAALSGVADTAGPPVPRKEKPTPTSPVPPAGQSTPVAAPSAIETSASNEAEGDDAKKKPKRAGGRKGRGAGDRAPAEPSASAAGAALGVSILQRSEAAPPKPTNASAPPLITDPGAINTLGPTNQAAAGGPEGGGGRHKGPGRGRGRGRGRGGAPPSGG